MEPLAPQDEPQEEDDGGQATVEDEEEHATVEWALGGEHEEDEEASASEAGESERTHESVGADGDEELPVSQASQEDDDDDPAKVEDDAASATEEEDWEEDNERSERLFGYDPDRDVKTPPVPGAGTGGVCGPDGAGSHRGRQVRQGRQGH